MYPDELATLKIPPNSLEAEQSVIGAMLVAPKAVDVVIELLDGSEFYTAEHREIFSAMLTLHEKSQPIDVVTLCDFLNTTGRLDKAGGFGYVMEIAKNTPSVANVLAYARAVREKFQLRRLIISSQKIADSAFQPDDKSAAELIDNAQAEIMALNDSTASQTELRVSPRLKNLIAEWERRADAKGLSGLSTGLVALDRRTHGLNPGDLIILAARPAMGKTSLAMNIAESIAITQQKPVLIFSMEMTAEQLLDRSAASVGRIPYELIRTGAVFDDEQHAHKVSPTILRIKDSPLFIDDRPALTIGQMRSSIRRASLDAPLSLIVVDYLQLARAKAESRVHEVTAISQGLKALAKEFKCPVIALSQLSRKCEERTDKRPMCSDLRDSGAIEQDADIIWFIYRDEVYNEDSDMKGVTELICAKQRNGSTGTDYLASNLGMCRFDNLSSEWQRPQRVVPMRRRGGFEA